MDWSLQAYLADKRLGRSPVDADGLRFKKINIEQVALDLKIDKQAAENGKANIPSSDSTQFDGPQDKIEQYIKGEVGHILAWYADALKGLDAEMLRKRSTIDSARTRILKIASSFELGLSDIDKQLSAKYSKARKEFNQVDDQYWRLRKKYDIEREADYPDSRLMLWAMLIFSCVLEGVLNALFFGQGMMQGLVGGAAAALVLAFVDIVFVYYLGRAAAWVFSRRTWYFIVGIICSLIFVTWAVFYNLLTANIREQLQLSLSIQEASRTALIAYKAHPFGLELADSWILFGCGLLFSLLGFISGIKWDDKIPFYGSLTRKRIEKEEDVVYYRGEYREEANSLREKALSEIEHIPLDVTEKYVSFEGDIGTKAVIHELVNQCITHYEDSYRALIRHYRDRNIRARSDDPPVYFDESITISFEVPDRIREVDDVTPVSDLKNQLEETWCAADEAISRINTKYETFLQSLPGSDLQTHVLELTSIE